MRLNYLIVAAFAGSLAAGATATTVLNDDFSGETPALQVASLANFTVTGGVDVVGASNPYGIVTSKNVVDLDGTPGPGRLTTNSFAFGAGKQVTLTFVLGGAQRGSVSDEFEAGFAFSPAATISGYTLGGGYGGVNIGGYTGISAIETFSSISGTSPFTTYSLSFLSVTAGSLTANIGSSSADNVGPLLSSVTLDIGTVPEPASWALMIAGFGLVGVAARRRAIAVA